jgi:hypothetical protein
MSYPTMDPSVPWSLVKGGFKKTPHFNSQTQKPAAGRGRSSISLMPYPTWDFEVDLDYVCGGESVQWSVLQTFLGCYLATCGGAGFFLFTDPNDNTVENPDNGDPALGVLLNVTAGAAAPMGQTGDGVSPQFQLARIIGLGADILQNVSNVAVFVDGAETAVTLSGTGVVTFSTPPAWGAVLTWEGSFQYLCQFTDDTLKGLARVNKNSTGFLWSCPSIAFEGVFV